MAEKETNLMKWQATLTPEQLREVTVKANKASTEAKRKKKELKNYIQALLEIKDDEGVDNYTKLVMSLYNKALEGDVQAFNSLRDTAGMKPKEEVEISSPTQIHIKLGNDE